MQTSAHSQMAIGQPQSILRQEKVSGSTQFSFRQAASRVLLAACEVRESHVGSTCQVDRVESDHRGTWEPMFEPMHLVKQLQRQILSVFRT